MTKPINKTAAKKPVTSAKAPKAPKAPRTVKAEKPVVAAETPVEAPVTVSPAAPSEPTVSPWESAAAELMAANPVFAAELTADQVAFIVGKCAAFTTYKDALAVYGGSGSVNSFARQLIIKVNPDIATRKPDAAPTGDTMVFCDLCGRSVPVSGTTEVSGKRACNDTVACKKAKGDPKIQTQRIAAQANAKADEKASKAAKTPTSGRAWPWPDTSVIVVINPVHGRSGVRADIFGKICVEQTVAELKAKTFTQRGGTHKMPVADVIAAVKSKYITICADATAAEAYKADVIAAAALAAKPAEPTAPATDAADTPEDACIAEGADVRADIIANA